MEQASPGTPSELAAVIDNTGQWTRDRISAWHLALFLVFLPFDMFYSELVLISLLLHTLVHMNRKEAARVFSRENGILSGIFLLNIIWLALSPDKKEGTNYLLRQLALLLFPFIFSLLFPVLHRYRKLLLQVLGFTCMATLLYLYADAFRIIFYYQLPLKTILSQSFINHNFSAPIGMHATYLSLYMALAAVSFLHLLIGEQQRRKQVFYSMGLLMLFAGLIQLSSRSVLISFLLISVVIFPFFIPPGKKRVRYVLVILAVAAITVSGIIRVNSFNQRYVAELKNDLAQKSINNEMLESRVTRWKTIGPLALRSPVVGQGTGAEKELLQEAYFRNKLYNSYLHELNSHNQYLKIFLETGLIGLLFFLFTLLWGLYRAWANRDIVFLSFMILVAILCFSENMLDVNKGIFFYAFFFSFFVKGSKPAKDILRFSRKVQP